MHHDCLTHDNDGVGALLSAAVRLSETKQDSSISALPSVKTVKLLLKHGADPNMISLPKKQSWGPIPTVWQDLLRYPFPFVKNMGIANRGGWAEAIYWFLVYGADATVDLGPEIRIALRDDLSRDQRDRVLAIMKAARRRTWFIKKKRNPNLDFSGHFKIDQ